VAEPDPHIGKVLQGRYRIVEAIASGGMGVVYRGERLGLNRAVAIKFVWPALAQAEHARKRFEIEAQAMSRLTHPSCVGVIDFGVEDGAPYLVMDFARGRTLKAALKEGSLPVAQALDIAKQILGGLAHAHAQGIIHRDIKPDNIVLQETEGFGAQVRILDFGLAKLKDSVSGMTAGFAVGTPSYMSPEQTIGEPVDHRADLYAVGVLLFEMLTGARPFTAEKVPELLHMHRFTPPPPLPGVPPWLQAAVHKAMAKQPAQRFASAAEFAAALDGSAQTPVEATAATVAARISKPRRRWQPLVAAGAGVTLVLVTLVALWPTHKEAPLMPIRELRPPTTAASARVPGLDEAEALVQAGRSAAALDVLRKLHAKYPQDPDVAYLMGNLYFDRMWWADGFDAYRVAVGRYRQDPVLISNVVKSFISDRYAETGVRFIEHEIGAAAIPALEEAARGKSLNVRTHAQRLLARLR
jgi:serine/threonine-protein kinase